MTVSKFLTMLGHLSSAYTHTFKAFVMMGKSKRGMKNSKRHLLSSSASHSSFSKQTDNKPHRSELEPCEVNMSQSKYKANGPSPAKTVLCSLRHQEALLWARVTPLPSRARNPPHPVALVSAGKKLIFFLVAGTVLCFGFSVRILLIIR